jgi:hypothetical protein
MKKPFLISQGWTIGFLCGTVMLLTVPFSFAQESNSYNPFRTMSYEVSPNVYYQSNKTELHLADSLAPVKIDTLKPAVKTEKKFKMKKSPWLAVLFSAILPGAGQFYNQSYWKVPVLLGLTAYLGYEYYDNNKTFRNYRDQYAATQTPQFPSGDPALQALRNFYRDQRDDFVWYFAIVYFINLVDAYVDAHLFDFDVRQEKIITTGRTDRQYKLNFHLNF